MLITASFKLLKNGRKLGGDRPHLVVSTNISNNCTVVQPFVDCFVSKVRASALIDSESMISFINNSVQATIDVDEHGFKKFKNEKFVFIAGHPINLHERLS